MKSVSAEPYGTSSVGLCLYWREAMPIYVFVPLELEINKRLHSRTLKLNNNENRYRQYSGLYQ